MPGTLHVQRRPVPLLRRLDMGGGVTHGPANDSLVSTQHVWELYK
jgi:hypothetical protein